VKVNIIKFKLKPKIEYVILNQGKNHLEDVQIITCTNIKNILLNLVILGDLRDLNLSLTFHLTSFECNLSAFRVEIMLQFCSY